MNRKDLVTLNLSYIFLALAVLAVSMALVSLIRPMELPVPYASSNEVSVVPVPNRGQLADTARWQGLADAYKRQRALQADTARWQGMAEEYLTTPAAAALTKAQQTDAARWKALANNYFIHNGGLSGKRLAEAVRWTAMAFHYGVEPVKISPQLKFLLHK
jgi:hypothetical protein